MIEDIIIRDVNRSIKITRIVLETIRTYIQYERCTPEAGGILAGKENVSDRNLIIDFLTEPMHHDVCKRTRFIRKDKNHKAQFQRLYHDNDETYRYVGEWHTHPEANPSYSFIDLENWCKLANEDQYNKDHFQLIAGTEFVRIWKVDKNMKPLLLCSWSWKDNVLGSIIPPNVLEQEENAE